LKTLEVLEKVSRGKRVRPNTLRHYRESLTSLAKFSEDWPTNGSVINEWLSSLDHYGDSTIRLRFDYVNSAGKYVKKAFRIGNPCDEAERPKVSKKRRRYFTPDEIYKILGSCRFAYDRELILTLIDSTCRIGELVGLRGRDIGDGFIRVSGKTGERKYRLDLRICNALRALAGNDDGLVFKSSSGQTLNSDSLTSRARRIIVRAGLTGAKLGPHTLRHSGASLVAKKTGSALAVKALLQHDDIDTSMLYIHDVEDEIQQSVSPLDLVVQGLSDSLMEHSVQGVFSSSTSSSTALVPADDGARAVDNDMIEEMFPLIEDGAKVRPLLKTDDLRLLRMAFIGLAKSGGSHIRVLQGRELLKRILRRRN